MSFKGGAREGRFSVNQEGPEGRGIRLPVSSVGDTRRQRETASCEMDAVSWVSKESWAMSGDVSTYSATFFL